MSRIEDGKGSGNSAEVDDHGRLYTKANIVGHMSHHATYHKNGYIFLCETTLSGTAETPCALLQNDDTNKDLEIYWLRISSDADVSISIYQNDVYASGGNQINPRNTNFGSSPLNNGISAYEGGLSANLVLTTTNSLLIDGVFLGANAESQNDFNGGLVLPTSKALSIKATGANTNKIKIMLGYAEHSSGYKL